MINFAFPLTCWKHKTKAPSIERMTVTQPEDNYAMLMTIKEASAHYDVNPRTLRTLIQRNKLRAVKRMEILVDGNSIEEYREQNRLFPLRAAATTTTTGILHQHRWADDSGNVRDSHPWGPSAA